MSVDSLFAVAVVDPYIVAVASAAAAASALAPVMGAVGAGVRNRTAVSRYNRSAQNTAAGDIDSAVVICGSVLVPVRREVIEARPRPCLTAACACRRYIIVLL